ncbi:MAG: hypothetical protein CTY13_06075, partial [Methylobacter sp.]
IPWDGGSRPFGLDNIDNSHYLGDPFVVKNIVSDFATSIHDLRGKFASGEISQEEFISGADSECKRCGDIFMGKNKSYIPVVGWNSTLVLGSKLCARFKTWGIDGKRVIDGVAIHDGYIFFRILSGNLIDRYNLIYNEGAGPDVVGKEIALLISESVGLLAGHPAV